MYNKTPQWLVNKFSVRTNERKNSVLNLLVMMKKRIIGNGLIASNIVAMLQNTENSIVEVQDEVNSILEQGTAMYIKNYHHLDNRSPSKTQLRKCEKRLHEFKEKNKEWFCQHCGISMRNRG